MISNKNSRSSVRLNRQEMSPHSGCLSKLCACDLKDLLDGAANAGFGWQPGSTPMDQPEDCAVLETGQGPILVTTDTGPLVGVDLWCAGRIAALHAMSDIYACGGMPRWVLVTLVVNPDHPSTYMETILAGLLQACDDEGARVVGGHTSVGTEALAGLTVLGIRRANGILRKTGALPGDKLLLSKPLGVGLIVRAYKHDLVGDRELDEAVAVMTISNGPASALAVDAGVHAATDITGFGLLGHLSELLGPDLGASLNLDSIPLLKSVKCLPPGLERTYWTEGNRDYVASSRRLVGVTEFSRLAPLLDPQTNGGLLVAADHTVAATLSDQGFSSIGYITESTTIKLY